MGQIYYGMSTLHNLFFIAKLDGHESIVSYQYES
jgi:hypothetical protein